MAKSKKIRVVVVSPEIALPFVKEIKNDLAEMQSIVGGNIELVGYQGLDIICNEEGKLDGLTLNRPLYHDGEMYEVIAGQFFISAADEDGNQRNLTDDEIKKAIEQFTWTVESFDKFKEDLEKMLNK